MTSKTEMLDNMAEESLELSKERERSKNAKRVDEILNSTPGGKSYSSSMGDRNDKLEVYVVEPVMIPLSGKFRHENAGYGGSGRKWSKGTREFENTDKMATVSNEFENRPDSLSLTEKQEKARELLKNLKDQKTMIQLSLVYKEIVDEELTVIARDNNRHSFGAQTSRDESYAVKFTFPDQKVLEVID